MLFVELLADHPQAHSLVQYLGFSAATPVQQQALPLLLAGRDALVQAPTGSGKTLAFLLRAAELPSLVVLPTRELAQQVAAVAESMGLAAGLIHGGVAREPQLELLAQQPSLLIATPGRLIDLLTDQPQALAHFQQLVLDEGDRLLDEGFAQQVAQLTSALPQLEQRVCCSATWPPALVAIAQQLLDNPEAIIIDPDNVPQEVNQYVLKVHGGNKQFLLQKLLRDKQWKKVIVFTRSKMGADRIARALKRIKIQAASVHGGCRQNQRQRTIAAFEAGEIRVLVATDLAGRGLDFSRVNLVVNFNLPEDPNQYVHRVGRTGRAGFHGTAYSFVDDRELPLLARIEAQIDASIPVQDDHPYAGKGPPPPPPWKRAKQETKQDKLVNKKPANKKNSSN